MANIKKLQFEGKDIYPLTHIDAIVDDSGDLIKNKYVTMTNFEGTNSFVVNPLMPDEIQQVNARLNMVADDIQNNTLGTLIDKVGDLNSLQTSNKSNAVVAINDVISNSESIQNSLAPKLDKSTYNNKIAALTQNLNSVNASTDSVKSKLITALINNDINASNSESMESLIDKVQNISGESNSFSFPAFLNPYNVFCDYPDEGVLPILNFHIMEEVNGVLHILGGVVGPNGYVAEEYNFKHYCFDTDLGTITTISTNQRAYFQAASCVYSNSIYVYGTYFYNSGYSSDSGVACYNPTTRSWTDKVAGYNIEGYGRIAATMEVGSNNNIYVIGGTYMNGEGDPTTIFSYNPANNAITERQNPGYAVSYHASAVIGNYIYIFGGVRSDIGYNISNLASRYNTSSNSWSSRTNMPTSIAGHCAVVQGTDVYLLGGYFYDESYAAFPAVATFCYNTSSNSYLTNARDGGIYRNSFSQAVRKDNFIYIVGGMNPADTIYHNPLAFYMIDKDTFEYGEIDDGWTPGGDGIKPSVQPTTIMSNKIYSGSTQFKTYGTVVTYSTSSGLTMKPSTATYSIWSTLSAPIDVTDYTNVKLTFQCGTAGVHKFMIGASTNSGGTNAAGNGTATPVFNSGTSAVETTQTYGTSAYYVINIDISNLTGSKYLTVVACYDQNTVYYTNGIYITDFVLE